MRSGYSSHQANREQKGTKVIKEDEDSLCCLEKSRSPWPKSSGIKLSPKKPSEPCGPAILIPLTDKFAFNLLQLNIMRWTGTFLMKASIK